MALYPTNPVPEFNPEPDQTFDPWAHRSKRMRCESCMWFVEKENPSHPPGTPRLLFGRCRRHAPTMSGYPAVFGSDWCGDHKLDERRI